MTLPGKLPPGKLPAGLLADLLSSLRSGDARVLVGPALGRDAAVLDIGNGQALVATTDPVTFATERAGWYAVHVNANDIACMGAEPAWLLATALLPVGFDSAAAAALFDELQTTAAALNVALVGGHTEVTSGVDRPIISATMLGVASRDEVITGGAAAGDAILLTRGVAIEGTALLAREHAQTLRAAGVPEGTIASAATLLDAPGISIVDAARTIRNATRPRFMHDPTEGGIATALLEMAHAAAATLHIDAASIRVLAETRTVCDALALDPLGLLASGALLAVVDPASITAVRDALAAAGIASAVIGHVESGGPDVIMAADGAQPAAPFPRFERDELARFLESAPNTRSEPEGP